MGGREVGEWQESGLAKLVRVAYRDAAPEVGGILAQELPRHDLAGLTCSHRCEGREWCQKAWCWRCGRERRRVGNDLVLRLLGGALAKNGTPTAVALPDGVV